MTTKLQDLTDKIYNEGVQKAKDEAETILNQAREKASGIEGDARKKAEKIVEDAEKKAEETRRHVESEMKMALEQSVAALKQNISGMLTMKAIDPPMKELFSDKKYMAELITRVIDGWIKKEKLDLAVILPESDRKEMEKYFRNQLADHLNKGLQVSFSNNVKSGFKVGPADGSYVISFTEQDFNNFFKTYLRPKTNQLLFESEIKTKSKSQSKAEIKAESKSQSKTNSKTKSKSGSESKTDSKTKSKSESK